MVKEWFSKQEPKNEERRENIKRLREEIQMKNKKILTVAVDAGKGYTKYAYEKKVERVDKEGNKTIKPVWGTGLDLSSVVVGQEAKGGNTTYITINGEEKAYDFSGTTKMVENADTSKDNEEHRALMLRALFKVAQAEGVTDFNVVMCIGLDKYKSDKNIESMKETMSVGTFTIREDEVSLDITIHNVIIQPETLTGSGSAKLKYKDIASILVDIGTLNVGIVPILEGRVDMDNITAPKKGYHYMVENFKTFIDDETSSEYPIKMLDYYIRKQQGTDKELDELLLRFFKEVYSVELKTEINKKGFGRFATLVFLGGTSVDCAKQIRESFSDDYKNIVIVEDIFATVKGAYKKGVKELNRIEKENNN